MATLTFRDFGLNQTTITGRRNPDVIVDAVRDRFKRDPATRQETTELDGVNIDIIAARGKVQTVKLPVSCKEVADQISDLLKQEKLVKVNFGEKASTLRGRCYAMRSGDQLLQGVSCTATEVNITSVEDVVDDDFDDEIII